MYQSMPGYLHRPFHSVVNR